MLHKKIQEETIHHLSSIFNGKNNNTVVDIFYRFVQNWWIFGTKITETVNEKSGDWSTNLKTLNLDNSMKK